jgi:hypothetical protein
VLAKPERFTPPSHGARLPKNNPPRHYGGELSYEEASAQAVRDYPGMPPPEHTLAHRFLHNRWIHVVITVVCVALSLTFPSSNLPPPRPTTTNK